MPKVKKGLIFFVLCKLGIFDVNIIMLPDPGRSYIDFGSKGIMSFTGMDAAWVADYEKEIGESVSFFGLAEDRRKLNVTISNHDPRITKVGAVLRKTKLDETANLINILIGTMSFIGNRVILGATRKISDFSMVCGCGVESPYSDFLLVGKAKRRRTNEDHVVQVAQFGPNQMS